MTSLESGYRVEVDRIDKSSWHQLLSQFDDATFYQTWSYGEKFWGAKNLSHVVLRHDGQVVSAAQLRILPFPFLKTGAAYLNWGPLWRISGEVGSDAHLRNMLRALRNEYVHGRNYALRILPKILAIPEHNPLRAIFAEEKYVLRPSRSKTFIVDLQPSLDELRQNLPRSWRNSLKFAEKQDLRIWEATKPGHYDLVTAINKQMKTRKSYIGSDSQELLAVDADLPGELRLKVLLCNYQEETIAALGWSNIGKVSFPLVGGTGDKALQYKASFLLWWEMIKFCHANGFAYCDTAGVHEKRNPGGYFFKKGLAGKDATEMSYFGQFDAYKSFLPYVLFKTAMALREKIYNGLRRAKASLR
jgi:hypothetical protein